MQGKGILLLGFLLIMTLEMNAQNLSQHRWENRLVLLLTDSKSNVEYQQQINAFSDEKTGLDERKIIVYHLLPKDEFYVKYKQTNSKFEFVLIGLDGGEKLRQDTFLPVEKLYDTVDSMPMRKAEMRQ